jgi:hypothetical protein
VEAVERRLDPSSASWSRDGEGHGYDVAVGLREPAQHPEQVVADSGPLDRKRRDVDDDPHGGEDDTPEI